MTGIWDEDSAFYSASSRLARGYEHLSELERQIKTFLFEKPYDLVREVDPNDGSYQLLKFKFSKRLPETCTHLAAEALEALRSALDQAAYAAAVVSGKVRPKGTQFPISDSAANLENLITGRKVCSDVPDEIVTIFRSFHPYKGANNPLWALNKLRNSTHTVLIPIQVGGLNVFVHHRTGSAPIEPLKAIYDRAKNEIVFGRARVGEHLNYDVRPTFNVAFEQTEIAGNEYVFGFLARSARLVEDILVSTEAECRRLGFI
jgi:hypothetical protein